MTGTSSLNGATLNVAPNFAPAPGTQFTIIDNDGAVTPVTGTFAGLPEGATFSASGATFQVTYEGGNGNDVVLTVLSLVPSMPLPGFVLLALALAALGWFALRSRVRLA